jgi:hypothetical protein
MRLYPSPYAGSAAGGCADPTAADTLPPELAGERGREGSVFVCVRFVVRLCCVLSVHIWLLTAFAQTPQPSTKTPPHTRTHAERFEARAASYWERFYRLNGAGFFKDRCARARRRRLLLLLPGWLGVGSCVGPLVLLALTHTPNLNTLSHLIRARARTRPNPTHAQPLPR